MMLTLFILIASVVCVLLYESNFNNLVKGLLVATVFALASVVWVQHQMLLGWSSKSSLVDGTRVLYAASREPSGRDLGAIYYLTSENGEPRLHQLPYSEAGAQEADEVINELKNGGTVVVNSEKGDDVPNDYEQKVVGFDINAAVELPQK